ADPLGQASFVDLGCCSGFFSDAMADRGFRSSGVDISKDFIDWASRLAKIKAQDIIYVQEDLLGHLTSSTKHFDVISTFATVQWVMAQKGYAAGLTCFEEIFERADSICVIEMGYTTEPIYRDKIIDRPTEIDRQWVLNLMEQSEQFDTIELHPMGENGIWRDIFVGFKTAPASPRVFDDFPVTAATQTSSASGYWSDNWAGPQLDVGLQAEGDITKVGLAGWCPEECSGAKLTLTVADQNIGRVTIGHGGISDRTGDKHQQRRLFCVSRLSR
ncbi:class I SAM-dependent methyltransferase, partial [Luminiphilus sp.]|nr:class I SAM-dependent methyltransferase [Luminiphilus sp.]